MAGEDLGSNDVTITTVSGGGGGGSVSSMTVVDVTGTLSLPPAYDSLLPLYDDKDLPKYHDVVGAQPPVGLEPPPSYDGDPTARSTCNTHLPDDSAPTTDSRST